MTDLQQRDATVAVASLPPFVEFPSIARLSRDVVVTEKIDGTNASVTILEDGRVLAGSRTRWITPTDDNFGFAKWVSEHEDELRALGVGSHFGEWWGSGIQRKYNLSEKRFSLFNVGRWSSPLNTPLTDEGSGSDTRCNEVPCCHVVPVIVRCTFDSARIDYALASLALNGSLASPGFTKPEGIVIYHAASKQLFKKTLDKNDGHKSAFAA
jgi:hypothetical protein